MGRAEDIRPRRMDRRMDRKGGAVEQSRGTRFVKYLAIMVDEEKIRGLDQREMQPLIIKGIRL